jgi:hypothetical protein
MKYNSFINHSTSSLPVEKGKIISEAVISVNPNEHVVFSHDNFYTVLKVNKVENDTAYCESTTLYPKQDFVVPIKSLRRLQIQLLKTKEKISFKYSQWRKSIELEQVDNDNKVMYFEIRTKIFDKFNNPRQGTNAKIHPTDIEVKYGKIKTVNNFVPTTQTVGFRRSEIINSDAVSTSGVKTYTQEEITIMLEKAYTAGMLNAMATPGKTKQDFNKRALEQKQFFEEINKPEKC